ncbi:MAG TPA: hypothetical protein VML55_04975 [Planctomycetaceae bacterium]|nr:hypothetical protein [Planctomycetaceae bacterium]
MSGELLTRWTAILVVACWAARVLVAAGAARSPRREPWSRWAWTFGGAVYLAHLAAAFEFYHDWSHRAAWEHTARNTAQTVGLDWGGGIYFNYLAAILWPVDVLLAWRKPDVSRTWAGQRGVRVFRGIVFAYISFLIANATVVFGPAYWKWAAAVFVALAALAWTRRSQV